MCPFLSARAVRPHEQHVNCSTDMLCTRTGRGVVLSPGVARSSFAPHLPLHMALHARVPAHPRLAGAQQARVARPLAPPVQLCMHAGRTKPGAVQHSSGVASSRMRGVNQQQRGNKAGPPREREGAGHPCVWQCSELPKAPSSQRCKFDACMHAHCGRGCGGGWHLTVKKQQGVQQAQLP